MKRTTLAFVAHLVRYVSGFDPLPRCVSLILVGGPAKRYASRWGQSQMLVDEAIFVYGGKTDEFNSFGYTGAPSTNELLILPLSSPFSAAAPPWTLLASSNNESTSQGPHIAWSTLSPVNTSMALLLGGIADPNSDISIQTRADSAILIDVFNQLAPTIIAHPDAGYANEPVRRMQHAACTAPDGRVFIIGGVRADGSGNALSQHLIFDSSLSFTLLGSDGGPPAIYGHSCIMLPNGHLLVLGGLSPISGGLVPFDTIWALDTLRVDPEWFQLNISTNALPVPRRNFATALLVDGRILIHGGQDASAQAVYSDGWILDLSGDGVWEEVEVLSQLGARRDHFAVVSGNEVIFGFGYSSSAPAPAPLQIYDSLSNAFVASHTPLPSPPSPTIPGPVQTSKPAQTNTNTSVRPTRNDNGNGSENDGSRSSSVTAIAVGSALGALGVFLIIGGVIWYYRRQAREEYRKGLFAPLDDGEDGFGGSPGSGVGVGIVSAAAVGTAAGLPSEKGDPFMEHPDTAVRMLPERRDMLSDEDTRERRAWFDYERRRADGSAGSAWSLLSIFGAGARSREPSRGGSSLVSSRVATPWNEKGDPFDGEWRSGSGSGYGEEGYVSVFTDNAASGGSRPGMRREYSHSSAPSRKSSLRYVDPFADPAPREPDKNRDLGGITLSGDSSASSNQLLSSFDRPSSSHTSFGAHQAVQQQSSPSDTPSTAKSQQTSYFGARPSSILDPPTSPTMSTTLISSAPTQPLRRSDTWWGRFARTRFLDRGSSDASRRGPSSGLVDIRDPNPPPRLNPIEENQHSGSATSGGAAGAHEKAETHVQGIHNGKSTTSLQTTRTMDSEALERLGGTMQVVQRIRDASGSADSGNASFRRLSRVDTLSSNDSSYDAEIAVLAGMFTNRSLEEKMEGVMTPLATSPIQSPNSPGAHSSPTKTPSTPSSRPPPPRLAPGGKVASRVAAYERRMSQDVDSPIASPVGVKEDKTRRKHVDYGLAPRPSLFVTNPDSRKGSTSDS
ncbi:hypothetical protein PLEOSDRAFT_1046683 [Pleurotus ostreatus PC15]|uniref:Galactose oxidase n=1 Tax=Pleurotus ostreatus (strain PC15) TaxID=1137138 RepID=A0A067N980_PLEO1|nr:hypothetical protein PLEOSDRAFT_1046683 [Pleurotus ostreatus PC15]